MSWASRSASARGCAPFTPRARWSRAASPPSGKGAALSEAALFQSAPTPVTARFFDAAGLSAIPGGDPAANPHGKAVRFDLADGGETGIVTNSFKLLPVATSEGFLGLLQVVAAGGQDAAKPAPAERFMASHPTVQRAFASTSMRSSYARETYNGINAFILVDAASQRHPSGFRVVPVAGEKHLSAEDAARQPPDLLERELHLELARGPVRFRLLAQLARQPDRGRRALRRPDNRRARRGLRRLAQSPLGVTRRRPIVGAGRPMPMIVSG